MPLIKILIIVCLLVLLRVLRRRFGLAGPDAPLSVVQVLPVLVRRVLDELKGALHAGA